MRFVFSAALVAVSSLAHGQCNEIFISEYVEGWGNNKAIEVYNPTDQAVNLCNYQLERYANGITDLENFGAPLTVQLEGLLQPQDVIVFVVDKQDPDGVDFEQPVWEGLAAVADVWLCPDFNENATMYFNGNDALLLRNLVNNEAVDIFGRIGEDPGTGGWASMTPNHTLIRKYSIGAGDTNGTDDFLVIDEWEGIAWVEPVNEGEVFGNLGQHDCLCDATVENGCTNSEACNYNPNALTNDGTCLFVGDPCDDCCESGIGTFTQSCQCVSECDADAIFGCTNSSACNYNAGATASDGSCYFPGDPCDDGDATTSNDMYNDNCECEGEPAIAGCISPYACNYNPDAVESDGSCYFPGDPCDDGDATTSNDMYNDSCECQGESAIAGCINPNACNYNPDAVESDGSCYFSGDPCDDGDASTSNDMYNDSCECEGESAIVGCVNPNACNYDPDAVESDGSCYFPGDPCDDGDASTSNDMYNDSCECEGESAITGCINPNACNYNADATESDGSCLFPGDPCDDGDESTTNDMYTDSCECQGDEPSQVSEDVLELALFPNPVHDWLSVRLEDGLAASLILFDPMGRVVQTWSTIGSARLDLSHLPPGPYVMSIHPRLGPIRSERISILTWD